MGSRGPQPLPTQLKLIRGNPGREVLNRHEPQPRLAPDVPVAPDYLTPYAREEWDRIITEIYRLKLVTIVDVTALTAYCETYSLWRTAKDAIAAMAAHDTLTKGLMVKTPNGVSANPLVSVAQSAARDLIRFAAEFGLTPVARSRINAIEAIGAGEFEGLLGRRS